MHPILFNILMLLMVLGIIGLPIMIVFAVRNPDPFLKTRPWIWFKPGDGY